MDAKETLRQSLARKEINAWREVTAELRVLNIDINVQDDLCDKLKDWANKYYDLKKLVESI